MAQITLKQWFGRRGSPSQAEFASLMGVTPGMVSRWCSGELVSADKAPSIERITRGAVKCELLNPHVDWAALRGQRRRRPPSKAA
jgi:DNA-binding transcriptional regulator YdaS (Cro superfamily)